MGDALFNNVPFRLDPTSVSWDYSITTADEKTMGGKVVQIIGSSLSNMVVQGTFGKGGWQEQVVFLKRMQEQANSQGGGRSEPKRFVYPSRGWDFLVYLNGFSQPGAASSVSLQNSIPAPRWELEFLIIEDNSGLRQVAQDAFIARLAAGIGWEGVTKFNGPITAAEIQQTLNDAGATDVKDYISKITGLTE